MPIRIAHFSDAHILSLKGATPLSFFNKRLTGAVNLLLGRAQHYRAEIFIELLEAVLATAPTHTICTGDLVNLALPGEFARVAALLTARFSPDALTVIPGNHDAYTRRAAREGLFERAFADYLPHDLGGEGYPVSRLLPGLAVVGLSTAIPSRPLYATGAVGEAQLDRLDAYLRRPELAGRFRLLALHHPLLPDAHHRLPATRKLLDADALLGRLWAVKEAGPHLLIHGHDHYFGRHPAPGLTTPVIKVASASRSSSGRRAEFNVYVVEGETLLAVERHIRDPKTGRFVACDEAGRPL